MQIKIILISDHLEWRNTIARFDDADACQLPEYYLAYLSKISGGVALIWYASDSHSEFCYPFILTSVANNQSSILNKYKDYYDICSVYGYSGPLGNNLTKEFLSRVWIEFDKWLIEKNVIAEFVRFSPYSENYKIAHSLSFIESNRKLAISYLPEKPEILFEMLGAKTRNMIRKAERSGLEAYELNTHEWLNQFQDLYNKTMIRNQAESFFMYDQPYYDELLKLPPNSLRFFGVFNGGNLVSAAMIVIHNKFALYHLGATDYHYASLGAGNLALWTSSVALIKSGIRYLNLGGGRSTDEKDSLLKFKLSNSTNEENFFIGKRIINLEKYNEIQREWKRLKGNAETACRLLFYR